MGSKLSIPFSEKIKSIPGFFGIRLDENPKHQVLKQENDFEVREYEDLSVAKTLTVSSYESSSKKSFWRLAEYIFGGNQTGTKMSMTAPVFIESKSNGWMMTFVLPRDLTKNSVPAPEDKRVQLGVEPSKKWAVLTYTGIPNESVMKQMASKLRSLIETTRRYRITSEPRWAQYDGPMVIPFLRRNEVQMQIEQIQ